MIVDKMYSGDAHMISRLFRLVDPTFTVHNLGNVCTDEYRESVIRKR